MAGPKLTCPASTICLLLENYRTLSNEEGDEIRPIERQQPAVLLDEPEVPLLPTIAAVLHPPTLPHRKTFDLIVVESNHFWRPAQP
jgi:hypothetical protein